MQAEKLKIRRTKNRQFKYGGGRKKLLTDAEYAVFRGAVSLAVIIKTGGGWRACIPTEKNIIGTAISPVGMNKYKSVKDWIIEYFENKNGADAFPPTTPSLEDNLCSDYP